VRQRTPGELLDAVGALWADMQQQGVPPDETIFTNLARAAAVRGDAAEALAWAEKVVEAERGGGGRPGGGGGKMVARLRTFQPALVALALSGRADEALAVEERLAAMGQEYLDLTGGRPEGGGFWQTAYIPGLQPFSAHCASFLDPARPISPPLPESEYALLLEAIARGGTYAQFASVMGRMQAELNQLRPSTLDVAARFLASPAAAAAFAPGGPMEGRGRGWAVARWVSVDGSGLSAEAGACSGRRTGRAARENAQRARPCQP
jgi:hypothetical protein